MLEEKDLNKIIHFSLIFIIIIIVGWAFLSQPAPEFPDPELKIKAALQQQEQEVADTRQKNSKLASELAHLLHRVEIIEQKIKSLQEYFLAEPELRALPPKEPPQEPVVIPPKRPPTIPIYKDKLPPANE